MNPHSQFIRPQSKFQSP